MPDLTTPQRLDMIEEKLDNLPEERGARLAALARVTREIIEDWPRDAYPRLAKIQQRVARLWCSLDF